MMKTQSVISDKEVDEDFDNFVNRKAAIPTSTGQVAKPESRAITPEQPLV